MSDLHTLAERLETATGPDRALDGLLAVLDGWEWHGDGGVERHGVYAGHWVSPGSPTNGSFGERGPGLCDCVSISERYGNTEDAPSYTASLDAAVALCERCECDVELCLLAAMSALHGARMTADKLARQVCLVAVKSKIAEQAND